MIGNYILNVSFNERSWLVKIDALDVCILIFFKFFLTWDTIQGSFYHQSFNHAIFAKDPVWEQYVFAYYLSRASGAFDNFRRNLNSNSLFNAQNIY